MKRSVSAPCLADENNESKKIKSEEEQMEPDCKEYLQLALAKVLELQRQIKDDSYVTDNTSDLEESDSEEDLMKEVLTKVFKDLPGSSSCVTSIINKAAKPKPSQLDVIRSKSIQLSGYDTCRRVAIEFMRNVVKFTPTRQESLNKFQEGVYSKIETKMANRRNGLLDNQIDRNIDKFESDNRYRMHNLSKVFASSDRSLFAYDRQCGNYNRSTIPFSRQNKLRRVADESLTHENRNANCCNNVRNSIESDRREDLSSDYEVRIRMLRGLDLHLAAKQRDYTAKLMRY